MSGRTPLELGVRFDGRPHRLQVGVRPLDLDAWLLVDARRPDELRLKQQLLSERHDEVVATLPGSEAAGSELLDLVVVALSTGESPLIAREGEGWRDVATGLVVDATNQHPVEAAARLVQEDLCILQRGDDEWRLTAAAVCFPSRWRLADKIGQSVELIHAPVPGYERIARATDLAMERVTVERPMTRSNWTLMDDPSLFQPSTDGKRDRAVTNAAWSDEARKEPTDTYVRIERQTLRRLPRTDAIVFTIRTVVEPLTTLGWQESAALATTLTEVDPATVAYKDWSDVLPRLVAELSAAGHPPTQI